MATTDTAAQAFAPWLNPQVSNPYGWGETFQGAVPAFQAGVAPFIGGELGNSPATQAAMAAWQQNVKPVIQQQLQLQGLGRSPYLATALGESATSALLPVIQQDMQNRLTATGMIPQAVGAGTGLLNAFTTAKSQGAQAYQQGQQLQQQAAKLSADIANQEAMRQLQAFQQAGQMALGLAQPLTSAANWYQQQQRMGLEGAAAAGQLQQNTTQAALDAAYQDYLRRQMLGEQSTAGLFGGAVLPKTLGTSSSTTGGK